MLKKKYILPNIFVVVILLVEYRFFFLIKIPDIIQKTMTYHNKLLVMLLSFAFMISYGLMKRAVKFTWIIVIYVLLVLISLVYSYFEYAPSFNEIFIPLFAYLIITLYFPLRRYLIDNSGTFFRLLTFFNIIACLVLLAQYIYYDISSTVFLNIYEIYKSGEVIIRNNHIRLTYLSTIISLSAVISVSQFIINKSRLTNTVNIILSFIYFYFISQTRMYVIALLAVILFQYNRLLIKSKHKFLSVIIWISFGLFIFFALGLNSYIAAIIQPIIDGSYTTDGSYYARLDAITYFSEVIRHNPLFGNGLFDPNIGSLYFNIVHGPTGHATYTDVGILGMTAQFGLPMLIWFLVLLRKLNTIRKNVNNSLVNSLFLFVLFTSLTLIALDPQRVFFLACTLAIFDSQNMKKNREVEQYELDQVSVSRYSNV